MLNIPAIEELDENVVVYISGIVVSTLEAQGAFQYSGRVVVQRKTKRGEHGSPECIHSRTTVCAKRCQLMACIQIAPCANL